MTDSSSGAKRKTLDVTSPFDGTLIKTLEMQSTDEVQQMMDVAHKLYKNRKNWLAPYERIEILQKLIELVKNEENDFALLIAEEGGKPLKDAKIEVARAINGIELAIKELANMKGSEVPMGLTQASVNRMAYTTYEPIGVVLAVSAFNHPLNLIVHQVIPAIAVGCPVIVKPAAATPLNCLRFIELVHQAGLPKAWCQFCLCGHEAINQLVSDKRLGFLTFIGSAKVGWGLRSQLASGVRCALEHGGVAPVIVDRSADLDKALPGLVKGAFYHAGQVCVSVQRVFAHESIADTLANKMASAAQKLIVGDATKETTDVGPIIQAKEVDRIHDWVQEAISLGATCLTGGEKLSASTYAPTVLLNPPHHAKVSQQEVFGPVVCVYAYTKVDEAIAAANSLDYAFQAAVYSNDLTNTMYVTQQLDATAVMVNDHTAFRVDWMPFGGRRASGHGLGGIGYTMHDMLSPKMTVFNLNE